MGVITVKHVSSKDGWEKPKDGSPTWIDYWVVHSGYELNDFCRDCRKHISRDCFVGAHVKKVGKQDNCIYIVPTCKSCNTKGGFDLHEFRCEESIMVPANKERL